MTKLKHAILKLLRWSEQYTKTDMIYLAKGGGWLTFDTVVSAFITFGIAVAFANLLPKETYGTYRFILSVVAILAIPTLAGMKTALTKSVAQGFDGSLLAVLKERLRWGMLSTLGSFGVSGYYLWQGNQELGIAFAIIALLIPLYESFALFQSFLNGKKKFNTLAQYNIASRLFSGFVLVGTIFLTSNLFLILLAYFGSWIIARTFLFYRTKSRFTENNKVDMGTTSYGKHLSLMQIISIIANHLDKILLFHFLGAAQVAIYAFAVAIPEQAKGMLKSLSTLALPKFANRSSESIRSQLWQKIGVFILVVIPAIGLYWIAAPYIYEIFFPEYTQSIFYSQIYTLSLIGTATILPKAALEAKESIKNLYIFNLIGSVVYIGLLIVLVVLYGLLGAIIAIILKRLFHLGLASYLVKHV